MGSSKSSTRGSWARAIAKKARCFSPPDRVENRREARSLRPTSARARSTAAWSRGVNRSGNLRWGSLPSSTSSRTVKSNPTWGRCSTIANFRATTLGGSRPSSFPSRYTAPVEGGRAPETARSRVVFPAPLGPTTATSSPGGSSRVTPASTARPR